MPDEFSRLVTGSGQYTADLNFPGQLHGYVLRSPHAHANVKSVEIRKALSNSDVIAIFTASDLERSGVGSIPCIYPVEQADGSPMASPPNNVLASDRVRHVGDAVAFIVATSRDTAESAAELIDIDYALLPSVSEAHDALLPDAPELWPEAPHNICFQCTYGNRENTDTAFRQADRIVKRRLTFPRVIVNTLETRAAIAVPDTQSVTLHTQSQGAQYLRDLLVNVVGCTPDELHVVTPDLGGAFGIRGLPYPEQVLVTHAARVLRRPVKWVGERGPEGFLSDNHARDQSFDVELAVENNGRFSGIRMRTVANLGAKLSGYAPINSTMVYWLPGPYDIPTGYCEVTAVFTNTVQVDCYRGAGRAELVFPMEKIVDAAARELEMDPAQIRRRNFANTDAPTRINCFGTEVENRDYLACFETAIGEAKWLQQPDTKPQAKRAERCRGIGMASYAVTAAGGEERVKLAIDAKGLVSIFMGTQSSGQGHASVFERVVADALSLNLGQVRLIQGDTRKFAADSMTAGSRTIPAGVPACRKAAEALLERGRSLAAALTQSESHDITYEAGVFRSSATKAEINLSNLVLAATEAGLTDDLSEPGIAAEASYTPGEFTAPCGTHICEVEIDQATGQARLVRYLSVDDIGFVAAPSLAIGQIHGGVVQGLGQALLENCHYDRQSGQLLSGSLVDYALPRAEDVPAFKSLFMQHHHSSQLHGAGEMGTIASTPAILNAVNDALFRIGADEIDGPLTQEAIWRACKSA